MNAKNEVVKVVMDLMARGADIIKVGAAHTWNELTVSDLVDLNEQRGLIFEYDSARDLLTIGREQLA